MGKKKAYLQPAIQAVTFEVESGFASTGNSQLPSLDPWEGWTRTVLEFTLEEDDF
ncbi:MAG: hypothetical protein IJ014_00620 [Rikenellaceae bacterium]|nr:hypothetical protein [Rikenellaceae bacterium]